MDIPNQLLPTRLARTEYVINSYTLKVLPGITPAHVVSPDFWQHLCVRSGAPRQRDKLNVDDKIEVIAQDGSFEMELRVIAVDPHGLWAHVKVLRLVGEDGAGGLVPVASTKSASVPDEVDGYRVEFGGPHKFRIVRGNDVIETLIPTKAAAHARRAELIAEKVAA